MKKFLFPFSLCLLGLILTGCGQSKSQTFNIDFGPWRPGESTQTGAAAAGSPGDYWNTVGVSGNDQHTESGLKFANGKPSQIEVELINLGGGWGNGGQMGVKAPMLDGYNYPAGNKGGNSTVNLNKVHPGKYDLYIYGHGVDPMHYGDYTVSVGSHNYGQKMTSQEMDAIKSTHWVEGSQYVKFAGIQVSPGNKIEILIQPGGKMADGRTGDSMICGLQLISR